MGEQVLGVTKVVNALLGKPVAALLSLLHVRSANPEYPIPNHIAVELLVFLLSAIFFLWLKARLSVDRPGGTQQCMELLLTNPMGLGVRDMLESNAGHGSEKYVAMLGSIGFFVLLCNLISVVPGLSSPTAEVSVPFGCAILVFIYYNYSGVVKHGPIKYAGHFMGPKWWLAIIMFPIEIISNLARLLSLTVRLWVNMLVSELLYGMFLGLLLELFLYLGKLNGAGYSTFLFPLFVPVAFIALHIFVAIVQAFVFTILPVIYVSGAVGSEH
jgi:F-type H+-transporting ATPase subunit a